MISFLDDDDTFQPSKLSRVYDLFSADPDLCYYHHGQKFCNANSEILSKFKLKRENPDNIKFENNRFMNLASSINKSGRYVDSLWFNLSSVCVRKKIFNGKMDFVRRITGHSDDLMFYLAFSFLEKASLLNTNEPLT
ncbi:cell wall biosynthesis glycosyltransferase, partial [mine drainage metagenome]